jgi:uncharacterized protein YheU (UPF0270 family)
MQISISDLSEQAIRKIVEEFILREGTDYGQGDFSLEAKVTQVMRQLHKGDALLVYDERTESVDIISKNKAKFEK